MLFVSSRDVKRPVLLPKTSSQDRHKWAQHTPLLIHLRFSSPWVELLTYLTVSAHFRHVSINTSVLPYTVVSTTPPHLSVLTRPSPLLLLWHFLLHVPFLLSHLAVELPFLWSIFHPRQSALNSLLLFHFHICEPWCTITGMCNSRNAVSRWSNYVLHRGGNQGSNGGSLKSSPALCWPSWVCLEERTLVLISQGGEVKKKKNQK